MEKIFRDLCGQIPDFPVHRRTADQEWAGKEDWKNGYRRRLSNHGRLLDCHTGYSRYHHPSVGVLIQQIKTFVSMLLLTNKYKGKFLKPGANLLQST